MRSLAVTCELCPHKAGWTVLDERRSEVELILKTVQVSNRPAATDAHDRVKVAFVLIRAFDELGLLDVLPKNAIVGRSRHLASDKFRKAMRCRGGGKHGSLLVQHGGRTRPSVRLRPTTAAPTIAGRLFLVSHVLG